MHIIRPKKTTFEAQHKDDSEIVIRFLDPASGNQYDGQRFITPEQIIYTTKCHRDIVEHLVS